MIARRLAPVAITFDFGNTLVRVDRAGLRAVAASAAGTAVEALGLPDAQAFLLAWGEERDRQFRDDVPRFREVDLAERTERVVARLRGVDPPGPDEAWDQAAAAACSTTAEVELVVEAYSQAFVRLMAPVAGAGDLLQRLAGRHRLAILSNWPLAATIDRFAEAAGWRPHLTAIVVSQRVGTIKPHPAIFAAAAEALGGPPPEGILHVGDDWDADIVGAKQAGWLAAYLDARPDDSPLPGSSRGDTVVPDAELDRLEDLEAILA